MSRDGWDNRGQGQGTAMISGPQAMQIVEARMGQYSAADALRAALHEVEKAGNMLLPISRVGAVPPGYAVTLSAVTIDIGAETYRQRGGLALHKVALDRIAAAAGVRWLPEGFKRLDDGSHPYVYECQVVGEVTDLDGSKRTADGVKRLDLRGSGTDADPYTAMALEVLGKDNDLGTLRRTRAWIAEHCQSKARNRAIRSLLGIRQAYDKRDLERPFVAAKMVYTGRTGDPGTDRLLAIMAGAKELGGLADLSKALGTALAAPTAPQPPADLDTAEFEAPPPPHVLEAHDDDDDGDGPEDDGLEVARERMITLARRKGRLADNGVGAKAAAADGKLTAEQIKRFDFDRLADLHNRLDAMPDPEPAPNPEGDRPAWLPSDDEMPDWMRK